VGRRGRNEGARRRRKEEGGRRREGKKRKEEGETYGEMKRQVQT